MSNKIVNCQALLIICYEGKTKNLDEETYFKQLNEHIKIKKPSYIPFNEIKFIKREANQIADIKKTINFLIARGIKSKFSYICIWKDNDNQKNVQHENNILSINRDNIFKQLKKYLIKEKQSIENLGIWILPKGWNFETFYLKHFSETNEIHIKNLKDKFKEKNHFLNKVFNEENFKNISLNLKKEKSEISLFKFESEEN